MSKRVPAGNSTPPKRPATRQPRTPRRTPGRLVPFRPAPQLDLTFADEALRHWFAEEVATLQRLAHTQRLKGDYVAAQLLEREIRVLTAETNALLQASVKEQEA